MVIIAQEGLRVWLDDSRPMRSDCNVHAKNATEAIELLEGGNVAFISFDHDLGEFNSKGKELTGETVALWIEKAVFTKGFKRIGWDVHSANPAGAERIRNVMRRVEREWDEQEGATENLLP